LAIGEVLGESWNLYTKFLGRFFMTALIVYAVLDLLSALVSVAWNDSVGAGIFWGLVAAFVGVVGYFWVQTALVETVRDVRDGRADRTIGETFSAVQPRLPAAIAAGIVAAIGIIIGFALLIIPGLYLLTIWCMLIPVIVIEERRAGEAFTRSHDIVRGHGWQVFGLVVVVFLLVVVASGVIRLVFTPLPQFLEVWLGSLVAHSLTVPFAAAAVTTAYFRLTQGETEPEPVEAV
jgi:hypothetical protein